MATNGIVIINKEKGCTSNDVVKKIKKIFNSKVGHTGTLDPNATGVLPILIGDATKVSGLLINHDKEYEAVLQLGEKRSTADVEGEIIEQKKVTDESLSETRIKGVLSKMVGKQNQVPPIYSAIKVNGKKLYDYARKGIDVEIHPRQIEIYDLQLIKIDKIQEQMSFYVRCSKGTYIRTVCENIAEELDTVGYMSDLKRISVGEFNIKDAITVSMLEKEINDNNFEHIISIEKLFDKCKKIKIKQSELNKYLNGVELPIDNVRDNTNNERNDGICEVYCENKFIGLGKIKDNKFKRELVEP